MTREPLQSPHRRSMRPAGARRRKDYAVGDELREIPLFPLDVVLFPGMALPLHIFEPRYRDMTARCLDSDVPFGVVFALSESGEGQEAPARVGTMARIADYERLPDGRYNLLATGTTRFEIVELRPGHSYLRGVVRPLPDATGEPETDVLAALADEAHGALEAYLRQMLALLGSQEVEIAIPTEPVELSYVIGMCLTCDDPAKQELLEAPSVTDRLTKGIALLQEETASLALEIEGEKGDALPPVESDRSRLN